MTNAPLLTIVLETHGPLDRESKLYRSLLSARLKYEADFEIRLRDGALGTADIAELCGELDSPYVVFMRDSHQLSHAYVPTLVEYLRTRTVYLAEPVVVTGVVPGKVAVKANRTTLYARDTDVYGVVFNTRRLADALEAIGDLDRSTLYLGYRLYWSIGAVTPLPVAYSMASDTKAAIGQRIDPEVTRLVPLIPTRSAALRLHLVRLLVLFLRGMRAQGRSSVPLSHLRDLIAEYDLHELFHLADSLQPFEAAWLRWLHDRELSAHLYKQLSDGDAHLVFGEGHPAPAVDVPLYELTFGSDVVSIGKSYLPREQRPAFHRSASYDFYSRPVTSRSTILFFDRPMHADDNAEHLYEYFTRTRPEFTEAWFALNPKSPDWERLEDKGFRLLPIFTPEFYEKFLISDLVVSSQIYNLRHMGKSLANSRFVYLQHGVQLNDMTDWVLSKYFDVFVATGRLEADYLSKVAPVETINSGLPRMESLRRTEDGPRHLLFAPTWRFNLHQVSTDHFRASEYFRSIDAVLTDPRLLDHLERTDQTLRVKLHPNVQKRASAFRFSDRVINSTASYREEIESAQMVFTDYSSVVLDAAFIDIPIAYYQWDADQFFLDQPYESRLDYETEGLGPVLTAHDAVIDHLLSIDGSAPDPLYAARKARFFEGVDPHRINETIIDRMVNL